MARLTVIGGDAPPLNRSFADECRATLERVLATGTRVLLLAYETDSDIVWTSVPESAAIEKGFALSLAEELLPRGNAHDD